MKNNNTINKILFMSQKVLEIIISIFLLHKIMINDSDTIFSFPEPLKSMSDLFLLDSILSRIVFPICLVIIYISLYRAFTNLIFNKRYSKKWLNILLKVLSIVVLLLLIMGLIYFIYCDLKVYSTTIFKYNWWGLIKVLLFWMIPFFSIYTFSQLYNLKYKIQDKKHVIAGIVSTLYFVFTNIMTIIEYNLYHDGGSEFIIFSASAIIPIFLFNIYTLWIVIETKKKEKKENS